MAGKWYAYGVTAADYTVVAGTPADDGTAPVLFKPGGALTGWNQETAGTQQQLALDADGSTLVSSVTSSTGADGRLPGSVLTLYAQVPSMWIDGNGGAGPRIFMLSREAADLAAAALLLAGNNLDAVTSLNDLTANVQLVVLYDTGLGAYPLRPASAGGRCVLWKGPVAPPFGGGYAVDNLDDWDERAA